MLDRFPEAELIQLTDKGPVRMDTIVDAVLTKALDDASAEIDGYAGSRYLLPLAPVPGIVPILCCDIARYRLQVNTAGEQVKERYEAALKFLRTVANGNVKIGATAAGAVPAAIGDGVKFTVGAKDFGREAFDGRAE